VVGGADLRPLLVDRTEVGKVRNLVAFVALGLALVLLALLLVRLRASRRP